MRTQLNTQRRNTRGLFALVGLNALAFVAVVLAFLRLAFGASAEQLRFDFTRGAKPSRCPYCESGRVTAHMGLAECRDCGREWGY